MKKLLQKTNKDDRGIAIMFSLIMLSVFFLISFGFVSMATSHKSAAAAREPQQQANLAADETVLNEALFAIEKGLISGQTPNYAKFREVKFINATDTLSVSFSAWATSSGDRTNLAAALPLQVHSSDDFTPDTDTGDNPVWSRIGWITHDVDGDSVADKYAWMVIDSSGVDPNYIGGDGSGTITGQRNGDYIREIDVGNIDPSFRRGQANDVYVNWTAGTPVAWSNKKSLISGLTSSIETAVELFEAGTSPITLTDLTTAEGRYDLSNDPADASEVFNGISWLNTSGNTSQAQRLACNITDYIDEDNIISNLGSEYGKERVPYINEVLFNVENVTENIDDDGIGGTADDDQPTSISITATAELVNIFSDITTNPASGDWTGGNSSALDGSTGNIQIYLEVSATRSGADISNQVATLTITPDSSKTFDNMTSAGYHFTEAGATLASTTLTPNPATNNIVIDSSSESSSSTTVSNVSVRVISIRVTGDGSNLWDYAAPGTSATWAALLTKGTPIGFSVEVDNPRNPGTWTASAMTGAGSIAHTIGSQNTSYTATDGESGAPWTVSTAYMPPAGKIEHLTELGFIPRGSSGKTINLTDYNLDTPTAFSSNSEPSANLTFQSDNTFNGGDRSLLNYVMISNPGSKAASGDIASYQQFGAINPNTSQTSVLTLLLKGVSPLVGPSASTAPSDADIATLVSYFPGRESVNDPDAYFKVEHFHDLDDDTYHNRNPEKYGYAFSSKHSTPVTGLNDAQREALVLQTMNLVSTKYSYFTIIAAVELSTGSTTSVYAFVRRDNESGSYKILRKTTQ